MKISIDPGQRLGVCAWQNGRPIKLKTLKARGKTFQDRRTNLWTSAVLLLDDIEQEFDEPIVEFAIEAFEPGHKNVTNARKLENLTGYLIHGLERWNDPHSTPVYEISKKQAPKRQAKLLAKFLGMTGDADSIDALHIGCLAGWLE